MSTLSFVPVKVRPASEGAARRRTSGRSTGAAPADVAQSLAEMERATRDVLEAVDSLPRESAASAESVADVMRGGWVAQVLEVIDTAERALDDTRRALADSTADELAHDRVRQTFRAALDDGRLLSSERFQERSGRSRQALSKAVQARRIFYVEAGGYRGYPAFYLDPRYERKQLEAVAKLLGDLSGGSKWQFFMTPKGSLARAADGVPRTPLQALEAGDYRRVREAATAFAQR